MEKEIKIQVPEGYEIDMEKSTFERIVFKKKGTINCWEDLEKIQGVCINGLCGIYPYEGRNHYTNRNIFSNEKYAKSALAMAQISQLLPYYDSNVNWSKYQDKHCICRKGNILVVDIWQRTYHFLAFNTREEAERFLNHNEQLVKDYLML